MSDLIDPRDCVPDSPFRPPSWRYHRCALLIEQGRSPKPGFDDEGTRRAWPYFVGSASDDTASRERLAERYPDIAEAFSFFAGADPQKRAELEARVLADQAGDEIAAKVGLSPAGVAAYEALFYDVRRSLKADTFIVNCVLGPKVHYGLTPDDHELLLKVYGYARGPVFLDVLLDYFRNPPVVPDSLDGLDHAALQKLLPDLRAALDANPHIWEQYANLALQAEASLVRLAAGTNLLLAEGLLRKLHALKAELAGESPSPLVKLLAERVSACWLQVSYYDALLAQAAGASEARLKMLQRERDAAHRRQLSAVKTLATVRKLLVPSPSPVQIATRLGREKAPLRLHEPSPMCGAPVEN
jgi:hypothetical protein